MFTRRILLAIAATGMFSGLVVGLHAKATLVPPSTSNEPVLVYDVTGETLLGPTHTHLAVYSSGNVSYASLGMPGGKPTVATAKLEVARIAALMSDITKAGAWKAVDQQDWATDVPLTTVTVLSGETDASAHTYSYWLPTDRTHKAVQTLVQNFIAEVFPGANSAVGTPQ